MKKFTAIMVSVILLVVSGVALVYGGSAEIIRDRIAEQQQRIDQGIASGALTEEEAEVVQDNLDWIKATFEKMTDEERLNKSEIKKLAAGLDQNSQMIFDKKNNDIKKIYKVEIPDRIANQQRRIGQGLASGALTQKEANVVQDNLDWIKATFEKMTDEERLNKSEIKKLEAVLDQNSQMIFDKKHNTIKKVY